MRKRHILFTLILIGMGGLGLTSAPAVALPAAKSAGVAGAGNPLLAEVNQHKKKRRYDHNRRWNYKHHGPRCKSRYGNCKYYYGGYYYHNPWWLLPLAGGSIVIDDGYYDDGGYDDYDDAGYGNRHVRWCMDRYRSYRPRTNTWVSYSGEVRRCISPYGP
jgi:hypothetical protein